MLSSDLEKVTKQARAMVTVYGLNDKVGNLTYYDSSNEMNMVLQNLTVNKLLKQLIKKFHQLSKTIPKNYKNFEKNKKKINPTC